MRPTHHRVGMRHGFRRASNVIYIDDSDCPNYIVINGERVCLDTGLVEEGKSGSLEKTNPMPSGRYWIDVFGKNIPSAAQWFKGMSGLGVTVNATETFVPTPQEVLLEKGPFASQDDIQGMTRNWYLFTVSPNPVPVTWDQATFGFPTIAGPEIKSSQDTVKRPDLPLDPLNELESFSESIGSLVGITSKAGAIALTAGLFIGVGYALIEYLKGKKGK